jgi:hypothetical protein
MQFVTSVFSKEYGIYLVNIGVYRKKEYIGEEYKTKIEIQIDTIIGYGLSSQNLHSFLV